MEEACRIAAHDMHEQSRHSGTLQTNIEAKESELWEMQNELEHSVKIIEQLRSAGVQLESQLASARAELAQRDEEWGQANRQLQAAFD